MVENFWIENAEVYSNEGFEINELGTHPHLVNFYNKYCINANKILDYGCGDGSLILKLKKKIEISLYDISASMLNIAEKKLKTYKPFIYKDPSKLPKNYFDCIFVSMVFICVASEKEIEFIIEKIIETKKKNGIVLIANPHPCFRDKPFSSYYTEYTIGRHFNYFNNGERHEILLRNKSMSFFDYNWSITYLINAFLKKGLKLIELLEIKDNQTNSFFNTQFSPSIIYAFK